jgi:hypothetical protein
MSINYSSSIPENLRDSYTEFDTVDFVLTFNNAAIQLGSIRLEGDLEVLKGGARIQNTDDIKYDRSIGAHGVVESIQTEMLGQVFENLVEYPRMVKMYMAGRNQQGDMMNTNNVCELKTPYDHLTTLVLGGNQVVNQLTPPIYEDPDFSIKPDFILNSSTDFVPYTKTGAIRISVNLARAVSLLYGNDMDNTVTYSLKNLKLSYRTTDDMSVVAKTSVLNKRMSIKSSIQSSLANIQAKVPSSSVKAMFASFQEQSHENTNFWNNVALDKVPNLDEIQFLFNDSTNQFISFVIKSQPEVLLNFVKAMGNTGKNSLSLKEVTNNDGYGVGVSMGDELIDLTNQKFGIQINSSILSLKPYIMYLYFSSELSF